MTPPTNAAGGRTIYSIGFNTSTTGALSGTAGSTITITFQSGDITHLSNTSVKNGAGTIVGFCNTANLTATCVITGTNSIGNSSAVTVELDGVINPAANCYTASVFTTSDPSSVPSTSYTIVSAHQISTPTFTQSSNAPGAANVTDRIAFNTSGTGALSGTAGSTITITFQSGTDITHLSNTSVKNGGGTIVGFCNTANLTATCVITGTNSIGNSSAVTVELDGVTNPPSSGPVSVFTTSDPGAVPSGSPANVPPTPPPAPPPPSTPPAVSGGAPTTQTSNTAAVSGTINPENQATTAFFQYGLDLSQRGPGSTTTLYDQSTPPQQVGSDQTNHTVTAPLTGLIPGGAVPRATGRDQQRWHHLRPGPDVHHRTGAPRQPPPVLGKSADLTPVSGKVFIKNACGAVHRAHRRHPDPVGRGGRRAARHAEDHDGPARRWRRARRGRQGQEAQAEAKTQSGNFGGAIFKLTQARNGLANLSLVEGAFSGAPTLRHLQGAQGRRCHRRRHLEQDPPAPARQRARQVPHHRPLQRGHRARHDVDGRRPLRRARSPTTSPTRSR